MPISNPWIYGALGRPDHKHAGRSAGLPTRDKYIEIWEMDFTGWKLGLVEINRCQLISHG